jgi:hypothetical protein
MVHLAFIELLSCEFQGIEWRIPSLEQKETSFRVPLQKLTTIMDSGINTQRSYLGRT